MKRLNYIDNLRTFLSILVVLHHVGIGYGTMGSWCYVTNDVLKGDVLVVLSALFGIEAIFSMSLFFFVSAYFTPQSLENKGAKKFLKGQIIRLGIPLLFVSLILAPSLLYGIEKYNNTTSLSWISYILIQITQYPHTSHAWFVLVLIGFECIYIIYWKLSKKSLSNLIPDKVPSNFYIFLFVIACAGSSFVLRQLYPIGQNFIGLQFGNFVPYVCFYALGLLVRKKGWLEQLAFKVTKTWFYAALILSVMFTFTMNLVIKEPRYLNNFLGGMHWEGAALALGETIICIGFCGFLIVAFKKYLDFTNLFFAKLAENRYAVYILHSVVVVGVTMLLEMVYLPLFIKFATACLVAVACSFIVGFIVRSVPLVKRIL